jgi:cysteine-rich repeat protein
MRLNGKPGCFLWYVLLTTQTLVVCICPPGYFADEALEFQCGPCNVGFYKDWTGGGWEDDCIPCPMNTFTATLASTQCQPCVENMTALEGQATCCATGTFYPPTIPKALSCVNQSEINCVIGSGFDQNIAACALCPPGTYSNTTDSSACQVCAPNTVASRTGSDQCVQCTALYTHNTQHTACLCMPGYFLNPELDYQCGPCAVGLYKDWVGNNACSVCQANTFAADLASTQCEPCAGDTVAPLEGQATCCSPGYIYPFPGALSCTKCPIGFASEEPGLCVQCQTKYGTLSWPNWLDPSVCQCQEDSFLHNETGQCTQCLGQTAKPFFGNDACIPCRIGTTKYINLPGLGPTESVCSCSKGWETTIIWSPFIHNSWLIDRGSNMMCQMCLPGTYRDIELYLLSFCQDCPYGSTNIESGSTDCKICIPGYFLNDAATPKCEPCPVGSTSIKSGSVLSTDCNICIPGYFLNDAAVPQCEPCPRNSANPETGSVGLESCRPCPYLYFQPEMGHASCVRQNVELDVGIRDHIVGLFVDEDTSCAYVARDISGVTDRLCWGRRPSDSQTEGRLVSQDNVSVPALVPICGDGIVFPFLEQCDDGNMFGGDGCNINCEIEQGFHCELQAHTKDLYTSLWAPSRCCRIVHGPVTHTGKCTDCRGRPPPYAGVRYDTHSCELLDIDECASVVTDVCFRNSKLCVNLDAVLDPQQTYKCLCASSSPATCTDLDVDHGAYTVIGVIAVSTTNVSTTIQRILQHVAELTSQIALSNLIATTVFELLQNNTSTTSESPTYFEVLFLCESWLDMQQLASQMNLTALVQLII